ncbi:hypothetical protein J8273_2908 [Carpediemonas membranifera]|uniref:Uncharacterized protein n=1 Tax=Carpediemonas membranifera TaxID=201153 RepID=A0A8J6B776_9EUKA|nr:hypothetical protein J8273_2908 [Carpediemonas membranifera]|eukprot:KAG9395704.1 hypothetical protein J8273_2908 [Carpediemonas membranifera]
MQSDYDARIAALEETIGNLVTLVSSLAKKPDVRAHDVPDSDSTLDSSCLESFETIFKLFPCDFKPGSIERQIFHCALPSSKEGWFRLILDYDAHLIKHPNVASIAASLLPHLGTISLLPQFTRVSAVLKLAQGKEAYVTPESEVTYTQARDSLNEALNSLISQAVLPDDNLIVEAWLSKFLEAAKPSATANSIALAKFAHRVSLIVRILGMRDSYSEKALSSVIKATLPKTLQAHWSRIARLGKSAFDEILADMVANEERLEDARVLVDTRARLIESEPPSPLPWTTPQ